MSRHRARDRAGFKLIELLVLILVIGVLVAMALPITSGNRNLGRIRECKENMRKLSQGVLQYEMTNRHYPGYSNVLLLDNGQSYVDPTTGQKHGVSYIVTLLPFLDQPALTQAWRTSGGGKMGSRLEDANGHRFDPSVELKLLFCPADPPLTIDQRPLSYVANCGMRDIDGTPATDEAPGVPRDWAANGVFFDLYTGNPLADGVKLNPGEAASKLSTIPKDRLAKGKLSDKFGIFGDKQPGIPLVGVSSDFISRCDGTAQTCLLSENVDAGEYTDYSEAKVGLVWDATGKLDLTTDPPSLKPPDDNMRINVGTGLAELIGQPPPVNAIRIPTDPTAFARPSSWHARGCNMAFCDGKVRFVSEAMDYYVYCLLMSSNGAGVRRPGSDQVLPNFDRPLQESWFLQ